MKGDGYFLYLLLFYFNFIWIGLARKCNIFIPYHLILTAECIFTIYMFIFICLWPFLSLTLILTIVFTVFRYIMSIFEVRFLAFTTVKLANVRESIWWIAYSKLYLALPCPNIASDGCQEQLSLTCCGCYSSALDRRSNPCSQQPGHQLSKRNPHFWMW